MYFLNKNINQMTREETKNAIAVMQHYADGGEVEYSDSISINPWEITRSPKWDWLQFEYRIKAKEPIKPEVGKWYYIPFGNGYMKQKCVAFEFYAYVFMGVGLGISIYTSDYDFSNFKEAEP